MDALVRFLSLTPQSMTLCNCDDPSSILVLLNRWSSNYVFSGLKNLDQLNIDVLHQEGLVSYYRNTAIRNRGMYFKVMRLELSPRYLYPLVWC